MLEPRVHPFKSHAAISRALGDFFALRPVVTLSFLRVIWWLYVIAQGWRVLALFMGLHSVDAVRTLTWAQWAGLASAAAYPILNILLARVALEVCAVVLLGRAYSEPEQRTSSAKTIT